MELESPQKQIYKEIEKEKSLISEQERLFSTIDNELKNLDKLCRAYNLDAKEYLGQVKKIKEDFLIKEKGSLTKEIIIKSLFGIKEVLIRDNLENIAGKRSIEMKIEDAQWQQSVSNYILGNQNNPEILQVFWDKFESNFGFNSQRCETLKNGILAPVALMKFLEKNYELEVDFSSPEDDVKKSLDLIAVKKNKLLTLIQVKGGMPEKGMGFLKIFNDFKRKETLPLEYKLFKEGCENFIEEQQNNFKDLYKENSKIIGAYIFIPKKLFDPLNGNPKEEFNLFFEKIIEEKNMKYFKEI